jgi:hypothetical protein
VRGFFSVAHDEYYSRAMFENLKGAIAQGLNVAFLSGNTCYEMVELTAQRTMRRVAIFGEHEPEEDKVIEYGRPELPGGFPSEATLIGAETIFPVMSCGDWVCVKPEHWLFEGTGMKKGDAIPGLVGYEWHGKPAAIPGLEVLASGTARASKELTGVYTATIYPGPEGQLRVQRVDDLVGERACGAARVPPGPLVRGRAQGAGPAGAADDRET